MNPIEHALLWLDADRVRLWTCAWLAFGGVVLAAWRVSAPDASPAQRRWNGLLFALAVCLALAAFRWPVWFYPHELNPDEAQIVAGAITLDQFPVYWKYVDGTTHGPWCEYLLLAAHWLGAPFSYFSARVVALLLEAGALLAVWATLRHFTTERVARAGILPGLAFWSFVSWDDFLHYSTELPGLCFLAVAAWLIAVVLQAPAWRPRHFWAAGIAGFLLGSVPFAKLQSVPQSIALALVMVGLLWRGRTGLPAASRRWLAGIFVAAGFVPALIVVAFLTVYGLWEHFRAAYILSALDYLNMSEHPPQLMPTHFFNFSATAPAFAWFFWGTLAFALLYARARTTDRPLGVARAMAWLLVGAAYFSVLRPAREVAHYLHLLVIPLTTLGGLSLAAAVDESRAERSTLRRGAPWLMLAAVALVPQVYQRIVDWNRFAGFAHEYRAEPPSDAALFLRRHAHAGDTVAMWGWDSDLLVATGLPHGTRESHTANQIMIWPLRPYYVTRYLWDMERREPEWFVDVVGEGAFAFVNRARDAHEAVPALRELVDRRYELVGEFKNQRIYRRRPADAAR